MKFLFEAKSYNQGSHERDAWRRSIESNSVVSMLLVRKGDFWVLVDLMGGDQNCMIMSHIFLSAYFYTTDR